MFGFKIGRVRSQNSGVGLPKGSVLLFRKRRRPKRGDVVLVDHPELGRIVKKVTIVGRKGSVHLKAMPKPSENGESYSSVPRDAVLGVKVCKLF